MKELTTAIRLFVALTILTGIIYPLLMTGIGQALFSNQVNGSVIVRDGKVLGSKLIGQQFDDPKYFWGRLSATGPFPYNAAASSGSNLGPTNPALIGDSKKKGSVGDRVEALKQAGSASGPVPTDLATASGSGLDPHISPAAAEYQVARVAQARGMAVEDVRALVKKATTGRQFGFLGEPVVNVLELNLSLDASEDAK